jgi:hypothetical protein
MTALTYPHSSDSECNVPPDIAAVLDIALRHHEQGRLGYRALAYVMGEYHGVWYSRYTWNRVLLAHGATPSGCDHTRRRTR